MSILIDLVNVIILPCGFRTIYECTCPRHPQIDTVFLFFVFPFCRENFPGYKTVLSLITHSEREKKQKNNRKRAEWQICQRKCTRRHTQSKGATATVNSKKELTARNWNGNIHLNVCFIKLIN